MSDALKEHFKEKVQKFKLQNEFMAAVYAKDVETVKGLLSKIELDLNYVYHDTEVNF